MRVRIPGLIVMVALVASGCGGGDGSSLFSEPAGTAAAEPVAYSSSVDGRLSVVVDPEVMAVAEGIVDRLGADDGFDAVALALDAGYGLDQIAAAASSLRADGTIPGVAPQGPAADLLAAGLWTGGGVVVVAAAAGPMAADGDEEILRRLNAQFEGVIPSGSSADEEEAAAYRVGLLLALVATGYSFEQVALGLTAGEQRLAGFDVGETSEEIRAFECVVLANSEGELVYPAMDPSPLGDARECHAALRTGPIPGFLPEIRVLIDGDIVAGSTTTATSTPDTAATSSTEDDDSNGNLDGTYVGTAELGSSLLTHSWVLHESSVEVAIAEGSADIAVFMDLELTESIDAEHPCVYRQETVFADTVPAGSELEFELAIVSADVVGADCPEGVPVGSGALPGTATVRDGVVMGNVWEGYFTFTARRQ